MITKTTLLFAEAFTILKNNQLLSGFIPNFSVSLDLEQTRPICISKAAFIIQNVFD